MADDDEIDSEVVKLATLARIAEVKADRRVAVIIEKFLTSRGISVSLQASDFTVTKKTVVETLRPGATRVSPLIFQAMSPKLSSAICYHYTRVSAFKAIATTNSFRLGKLSGLLSTAEYKTFGLIQGLDGVLGKNPEKKSYTPELTQRLYVGSFSDIQEHDPAHMWAKFCDKGTGVRLTVSINPKGLDLRQMQYGAINTILTDLNNELKANGIDKPFLLRGLAKAGAFYLPSSLIDEGEVRLLMADHGGDEPTNDPAFGVIKLDDPTAPCHMVVTGVEVGARATDGQRAVITEHANLRGWPILS